MSMFDNENRYGSITRMLHWGMAILILWQFTSAGSRILFEDTAFEAFMWSTHKPLGALLLLLIGIRLAWALINLSRRPPSVNLGAKLGHIALYGLLIVIPSLGLLRQYGSGRSFEPFGIPLFSGFEGEIEFLVEPGNLLHGALGWVLLVMIIGHIGMVVWHRKRIGKQDVLPRMW